MRPVFYYDLNSPYAWLSAERTGDAAEWVPVLVGAIFAAKDRVSWGVTPERAAGQAEVERRARERGLPPVRWPEPWPNNGLQVMRAAVVGGDRFAVEAFRVHFVDGLALSEPANIALAAERAGLDPAAVLAATGDPEVKARLRANTDAALAAGVFGVPSVVVGGHLFWGDDRLDAALGAAT
jgi:2-hydroxychromene-2-carboxylate isomerase